MAKKASDRTDKRLNNNFVLLASLVFASVLSFVLQNSYASNASAASMTLTVPPAINLNVNPDSTLTKSSASTFSAKTDGAWGYNLSIKAKSTTDMVNGSAKLTTIPKTMTESEYTAAGNNNTWGFIPSKLNGSANTNFVAATTSATTIEKTSSANSSTANNYSLTLGAKVDHTAAVGAYSNTVVMTLSANTVNYTITYNLNSGSWSGTSPQTGTTTASSVTLDSHTPTKSNYTFEGWCSSSSITNNNTATTPTCGGTKYNAGGTYNLSSGSNNLQLYAMWKSTVTYRSYTINYYSNVGSPSGMPSRQTGSASSTNDYKVSISSTSPTLSGYNFMSWCSSTTSNESCSGTTYKPGNSWTVPSDNATLSLYAMWGVDQKNCPQEVTICSNGSYLGKRFGSGKCWMSTDFKSSATWSSNFGCPSGWSTPTQSDFNSLISSSQAGSGACLYGQGWSGYYWASTYASRSGSLSYYYSLNVSSTSALIYNLGSSISGNVRCVSS